MLLNFFRKSNCESMFGNDFFVFDADLIVSIDVTVSLLYLENQEILHHSVKFSGHFLKVDI